MTHLFKVSRLIGLLALVLGLMAFGSTAAQAETGAHWNVSGVPISGALLPEIQASLESNHGILLTKIGLSKVEILCTALKLVGAKLHELGKTSGKFHLSGCITKLNGVEAKACVPHSPKAANGLIESEAFTSLIQLHKPTGEESFGDLNVTINININLGKEAPEKNECAIGEKFVVSGALFLKDCQKEGGVEKVTHLLEEGPLSTVKFGANPMTFDGSINVSLAGAHAGLKWSGIPG